MLAWSIAILPFITVLFLNACFGASQSRTPGLFSPSTVPLVIKSPYFNCWIGNQPVVPQWPTFWNDQNLGWSGYIRVDDVTWMWLGRTTTNPQPNISVPIGLQITPTRTIYTFHAGPITHGIRPADPVKQSLPFAYMYLEANSTDSQLHTVQVYSDVTAQWSSGNRSNVVVWETHDTGSTRYHQARLQQPQPLSESADQAEDVTLYFAMPANPSLSSRIGLDNDCRGQFISQGLLLGAPPSPSGIIDQPFSVFSHSLNLGRITNTSNPVVWSLGAVRDPVAGFQSDTLSPYFTASLGNTDRIASCLIDSFVGDFQQASQRATELDTRIRNDASSVSQKYIDLVSLAARQTIGATDLTIANTSDGKLNVSDIRMLMKGIGTSSRRVNPVEVLYSAFPFFLYLNASYGGYLLSPLLEYQDGMNLSYAARDLGSTYPLVGGNSVQSHSQQVEQTGNMLIMALAHAQTSGDGFLISRHYELLKKWANYLSGHLFTTQTNADGETSAGNANLIMKGIIGIAAMAKISSALNRPNDAQYFVNQSLVLSRQWRSSALSTDNSHILANFGDRDSSWSLMYNLYADRLLNTSVVGDDIYQLLTNYLRNSIVVGPFGFPLDSTSVQTTNAGWTLFAAAIVNDTSVRDSLIDPVWNHANTSSSPFFPPSYGLDLNSTTNSGSSSPAMGALYSILALAVPHKTIVVPLPHTSPAHKKSVIGPAVGGALGGLALVILSGTFLKKCRTRRQLGDTRKPVEPFPTPYEYNPYQQQQDDESFGATRPLVPLPRSSAVISSSKAREAIGPLSQLLPPNIIPPISSSSPTSRHAQTSSPAIGPVSPAQVEDLRAEMENLTRVVRAMQAERMETPPNYFDIQSQLLPSASQPNVPMDREQAQPHP